MKTLTPVSEDVRAEERIRAGIVSRIGWFIIYRVIPEDVNRWFIVPETAVLDVPPGLSADQRWPGEARRQSFLTRTTDDDAPLLTYFWGRIEAGKR